MISIQSFSSRLPSECSITRFTSTSAEGSVKGKKEGRKRTCAAGPQKRRANSASVAFRSTNVADSSTTSPSICANAGVWVAS